MTKNSPAGEPFASETPAVRLAFHTYVYIPGVIFIPDSNKWPALPNGDRAELGTKVEDYSLNSLHRLGQHTARVFESVLGITLANADVLRTALLNASANSEDAMHKGNT